MGTALPTERCANRSRGIGAKMSPSSRYRRERGNRVRFAPYNAIINHLPTMILFAASGPGVTYRDAPRTLGRRYITAICNIAFASTRRRKGTEERCPGPTRWRAIDRSAWPASIDLLARAPLSNRENIRATERQRETMNRERRLISRAYCIPVIYAFPIRATLRLCSASISIFFLPFFPLRAERKRKREYRTRLEREGENIAYIGRWNVSCRLDVVVPTWKNENGKKLERHGAYAWVIIPGSGAKKVRTERGFARGVRVEGENDGRERTTRIYACKPERPLYVVDAVIYDTYRSQLRVMALTLVFMAILFLVAFHGRRRLYSLSPTILSVRDSGPYYAKQPVILVWFTFPSTPKLYSALSTLPGKWLRLRIGR